MNATPPDAPQTASMSAYLGHVFMVEDDAGALESMRRLVTSEGYRVYPFSDPRTFLDFVTPVAPATLLLDMNMPDMTGLEVQQRLRVMNIHMPVIFVSGESTVRQAVTAIESGAAQFLMKPIGSKALLDAIGRAIALDRTRSEADHKQKRRDARLEHLTPREHEVLELLLRGFGISQICRQLQIAASTASQYKASILLKLDVANLAELRAFIEGRDGRP